MRALTAGWIVLAAALPLSPAHAQQRIALDTWLKASDYPADPARDAGTLVNLSYVVTPEGRVAKCRVLYRTAPKAAADATCALLSERARYVPRFDKAGNAVEWRDQLTVNWSHGMLTVPGTTDFGGALPVGNPSNWITDMNYPQRGMPRSGMLDVPMAFEIGRDGRITTCNASPSLSHPAIGAYTCRLLAARARFEMPLGRDGEPLPARGQAAFMWRRPGS